MRTAQMRFSFMLTVLYLILALEGTRFLVQWLSIWMNNLLGQISGGW